MFKGFKIVRALIFLFLKFLKPWQSDFKKSFQITLYFEPFGRCNLNKKKKNLEERFAGFTKILNL